MGGTTISNNNESAATAAPAAAGSSGGFRAPAMPVHRRRSRRREETVMTEQDEDAAMVKIRRTMKHSHAKGTRNVYCSYLNSIHEWYELNAAHLCTFDGALCPELFDEAIAHAHGMETQADKFRTFISERTHGTLKNADGTPARAKIGTLRGYRSAFSWWVWTNRSKAVPAQWDQEMKQYFKSLGSEEGSSPACPSPALVNPSPACPSPAFSPPARPPQVNANRTGKSQ